MNNAAVKITVLVMYIVMLSKIMGFRMELIINLPFLLMVLTGAVVLAFLDYKKEMGAGGFLHKLKYTVFLSGGLTTFLANVAFLSGNMGDSSQIYQRAVQNFLPLFYGFLFYFLLSLIKIPSAGKEEVKEEAAYEHALDRLEDYGLTRQEMTVSDELLLKLTNSEIAAKLCISESTVKKHISHIFQKVGVSNRTEFVHKFKPAPKNTEKVL